MREDYIEFKTAKLAKEKGFDEPVRDCYVQYMEGVISINTTASLYKQNIKHNVKQHSAPTQSLLQKWLRTKQIFIYVIPEDHGSFRYEFFVEDVAYFPEPSDHVYFDTWEEALEAGLQESLKLIKI